MEKLSKIIQKGNEKEICDVVGLCEREFSYEEIMQALLVDNIAQKQICVLKLDEIRSEFDAEVLIGNLCGQDGKVREVVAFKLCEFLNNDDLRLFFQSDKVIGTIAKAVCDINPNVAKLVCENIILFANKTLLVDKIKHRLLIALGELESFKGQKSHKLNKKLFNIYWLLQSVYYLIEFFDAVTLTEILAKSYTITDYPIREKAAQIAVNINFCNETTSKIKDILKSDENYYIRQQFV